MHFQIITIFPDFFDTPLKHGLLDKAIDDAKVNIDVINLRDFAPGKHRQTDDTPFGGGPGMVMTPQPLAKAIAHAKQQNPSTKVYALSPGGKPLTHELAKSLADEKSGVTLICGRYEGIDQRIIDHYCDGELSIGDYVLTGGEAAALVLIDAVSRQLPGVIGDPESVSRDSFTKALAPPQYTRPRKFEGHEVPAPLLSGNHESIRLWREEAALKRTASKRPDLLSKLLNERLWIGVYAGQKQAPQQLLQALDQLAMYHRLAGMMIIDTVTKRRQELSAQYPNATIKRSMGPAIRHIEKIHGAAPMLISVSDKQKTNQSLSFEMISEKLLCNSGPAMLMFSTLPQKSKHFVLTDSDLSPMPYPILAATVLGKLLT